MELLSYETILKQFVFGLWQILREEEPDLKIATISSHSRGFKSPEQLTGNLTDEDRDLATPEYSDRIIKPLVYLFKAKMDLADKKLLLFYRPQLPKGKVSAFREELTGVCARLVHYTDFEFDGTPIEKNGIDIIYTVF